MDFQAKPFTTEYGSKLAWLSKLEASAVVPTNLWLRCKAGERLAIAPANAEDVVSEAGGFSVCQAVGGSA